MQHHRKAESLSIVIVMVLIIMTISYSNGMCEEKDSPKNRVGTGEWGENPEWKIQVEKVEEFTKWSDFPFNERFTPAREEEFKMAKTAVDKGEAKFILVTVNVKNITDIPQDIGYYVIPASAGDYWIRGAEGSEQSSAQKNSFRQDIKPFCPGIMNLSAYVKDGFPKNAKIAPNGMASGKMMFYVPVWFNPRIFFTKEKFGDKNYEIIVDLKK